MYWKATLESVLPPAQIDKAVSLGNVTDEQLWRFLQEVVGAPNMTRLVSKGSRMCATEKKNAIAAFRELVASSRNKKFLEGLEVFALVELCRSVKEGGRCSLPNADERDLGLRKALVTTWVDANSSQLDREKGENIFPRAPVGDLSENVRKQLYVEAILVSYDVLANELFACDGGVPIAATEPAKKPPAPPLEDDPVADFAALLDILILLQTERGASFPYVEKGNKVLQREWVTAFVQANFGDLDWANIFPESFSKDLSKDKLALLYVEAILINYDRLQNVLVSGDHGVEFAMGGFNGTAQQSPTPLAPPMEFPAENHVYSGKQAAKKPVDDAVAHVVLKEPVGDLRRLNTMKNLLGLDDPSLGKQVALAMGGTVLGVATECFPSTAYFLNPDDASKKIGSVVRVLLESLKREEEKFYGRDLMTAMESSMSPVTGSLVPAQPEPQTLTPAENTEPDFELTEADRKEALRLQLEADHNQTLAPAEDTAPDFELTEAETYEAIGLERMYERLNKFELV